MTRTRTIYLLTLVTFLIKTDALKQLNADIDKMIATVENHTKGLMEDGQSIVLYNRTTSNVNDTHAYMIQKEREKLSIIPMFPIGINDKKESAKVQGGSFSLNPPKPNKELQSDSKIPEICKGKDTCHNLRLCKLRLPYWKKLNQSNSDNEESKEKVGIDEEDPGYEDAYKVSSETEEATDTESGDSNEVQNQEKLVSTTIKTTVDTNDKKYTTIPTAKKPCSCGKLIKGLDSKSRVSSPF